MNTNNPVFTLPPHSYKNVISTLSQNMGWNIKNTNIPATWTITEGEGEIALILDTGKPQHIDINDNLLHDKCRSFVPNSDVLDREFHSTHVIGTICAINNNFGCVGVAPKAKAIAFKVLGDSGSGDFDWIINALKYAKEIRPSVINMSLGSPVGTPALERVIKELYDMNIPIIAACGNSGLDGVNYPGKYKEVINVGAIDEFGQIANFSSKGPEVGFSAPGVNIYSTYGINQYAVLSGSSMASPWITGIVLLLLAKHKKQERETGKNDCKTVEQIREHLIKYTNDKGMLGRDSSYGYGVIDINKLILDNDSTLNTTISSTISSTPIINPISPKKSLLARLIGYLKKIFTR
jgi:major intracellular serine protease